MTSGNIERGPIRIDVLLEKKENLEKMYEVSEKIEMHSERHSCCDPLPFFNEMNSGRHSCCDPFLLFNKKHATRIEYLKL